MPVGHSYAVTGATLRVSKKHARNWEPVLEEQAQLRCRNRVPVLYEQCHPAGV